MSDQHTRDLFSIYLIPLFIIGFCLIEYFISNKKSSSLHILLNGSRSSRFEIFGIIADKVGFYTIALNYITFNNYQNFQGLLAQYNIFGKLKIPIWLSSIACLLTIDLAHYCLHRTYHRYDWLYNCHSFHHSAKDISIFTVYRDHILEYLIKSRFLLLLLWGPNHSLFYSMIFRDIFLLTNHMRWDSDWGIVGKIFVSPYFHKIHHNYSSMRTNFGAVFSFWDRIFKTEYQGPKVESIDIPDDEFYTLNPIYAYLLPIFKLLRIKSK